jgi:hypothetical protein
MSLPLGVNLTPRGGWNDLCATPPGHSKEKCSSPNTVLIKPVRLK